VHSANDACLLLVASVRGGRPAFIARMNQRAAALGMQHSHFADPCGFDAPGQYATAEDLLRLAQAAWQLPAVRAAAGLSAGSVRTRAGRELRFTSSNALLGRVPGVIGLKTGYTQQAGPCVIAVAQRDGHLLWLVLLGATDRWWRADALIRAALAG
jgi:D-alanyl-D-alanine carboxypeptidase (penicillin-binding protein 5/6)